MKTHLRISTLLASAVFMAWIAAASAAEPTYKAIVPDSVTTPDTVHTELLGDLEFFDGMPSKETVEKAYDFLDLARGMEAFLNGIPAASVYAILEGIKAAGVMPGELVGLFASIGIKKGQPFEPDARMKKILTEAVAIGNASARAITFSPRKARYYIWPDRKWNTPFTGGGNYAFFDNGERMLDDRVFFHYNATGITPAMTAPKVGLGSVYGIGAQDSNGDFLDGAKTYSVTLPGPVPAKDFWSFMVYDSQHRSMLETDQKLAGLDSLNPSVKPNADGSYTMWFGPQAPQGHEGNWIQTMPGKSFNVLLRL